MTLDNLFDWVACRAGRPKVIVALVGLIILGFVFNLGTDPINVTISIASLAISLMIVGKQEKAECQAHARDVAMHAKVDELIRAKKNARNDLIGAEERTEEEIIALKRSGVDSTP